MNQTFRIALGLGAVAFITTHASATFAATNVAPTAVVISAAQRAGTTFMDIDYRVNDPDDATVQTAALGFVNGGTNLADVIKIITLVEGTAANIGSNTPANTQKRLTWNMAADWNTNLGNVQVEILAKDGRGLLPFHWITLPTNGPSPEIAVNDRPIYDPDLLPIWYWLIAMGDPAVQLVNGQVLGVGGNYNSNVLAQGIATTAIGREFLWQRFNIRSLLPWEISRANAGRYGFQSVDIYSIAKGFATADRIYSWGHSSQTIEVPVPLTNVTAVAVGCQHTLMLTGGRVAAWGYNLDGETTIPASATNVVAIATGYYHSLALKTDGTVVGWGENLYGETTIPASATNVVAIAAGGFYSLALKADGTVVDWGENLYGRITVPTSATNVAAIAAGDMFCLALRTDGTIFGWGDNHYGQINIPASATNVVSIAAGGNHSLALKADGTVVVWGDNSYDQLNVPTGLSGIDLIGVGCGANDYIVVVDKRTP